MLATTISSLALLAAMVAAHGNVTSPPARQPGPAMLAACGADAVASVEDDPTTPIETLDGAPATCQVNLCRGATFADNADQVQNFAAGQVVPFTAILPIPHEGPMNVSIVNTTSNTVIGPPLISFASYADENLAELPANNTAFNVTMPQLPAGACDQAGECVMQWFWFGTNADQTYESCVDFVMVRKA